MLATNGDHRLGGKDWDDVIVNHVAEEFDRAHGENPLLDLQSYQDLQSRALAAKIQLSSRPRTAIVHSHNGKSVKVELTREEFELKTRHLVEKCKTICEMVLQEAGMEWSGIDKVLMVGGMTRMPMVREMVASLSKVPLIDDVNPDEAVAVGAAVQGILSLLKEEEATGEKTLSENTRQQFSSRDGGLIQVTNITSHTLGVVLWDEAHLEEYVFPMIRKMTAIPATARNSFGTASANMQRAVVRIVVFVSQFDRGAFRKERGQLDVAEPQRRRAALVPSERLPGRTDLRIQRQPGAGSGGQRFRQSGESADRTQHGSRAGRSRARGEGIGRHRGGVR